MRTFGVIFRQELHQALTTFASPFILVTLTALIPPSAHIQAHFYQHALSDYALRQAAHREETTSGRLIITCPVLPLLPLSNGLVGRLPDEIVLLRESASWTPTSEDLRFLDWLFSGVDLIVIVGVLMTLMASLMTYNTVTGEREQGTLKQVLSYSLPRHTILGGKLAASVFLLTLSVFYAVSHTPL
ncbi:MAG TPA: ABC transporter permease subunit [Blastocatellia bacterium]|nr:ABC transporter permease subunit [Blastocatellia bacterium]